jgi:hypothetical protein
VVPRLVAKPLRRKVHGAFVRRPAHVVFSGNARRGGPGMMLLLGSIGLVLVIGAVVSAGLFAWGVDRARGHGDSHHAHESPRTH